VTLADLIAEQWIASRLQMPRSWDSGVTTAEQRRERIRAAILERNLQDERAGWRNGNPETWAQLFRRVFRQPLQPMESTTDAL
jgi:hypothetical protein